MERKKINFLSELYERNYVSKHYKGFKLFFNNSYLYKSNSNNSIKDKKIFVDTIIAFPQFLTPEFHNKPQIKVRRIIQYGLDGYGIKIERKFTDVESYLKESFSHSFRSNIKRLNKRLDMCFSTNCKMYFGHIEKNNYDYLINRLIEMQVKRLDQKKIINNLKSEFDNYRKIVFNLINTNKASFFVIYNKKEAIGITLNFHLNNTFFGKVIAFDTNYSKFGIGNILIYKQLEWCIDNKYDFLDMGNGVFDYKRRWCNHHYQLETHIISTRKSMKAFGISALLFLFIKFKNIIKKTNLDEFYINLKTKKKSEVKNNSSEFVYVFEDIIPLPPIDNITEIDIENSKYKDIKKPIFDFLYSSQEHIDNISIYKETENSYIIKGKKKVAKCIIQNVA